MKYILSFFAIAIICVGIFLFGGNKNNEEEYMRIHIVANSNSNFDKNVKYVVKDAVVEFLIPFLADAKNKDEAQKIIFENKELIENVANAVLFKEGAKYNAEVVFISEDMPTRAYGDLVLERGVYDCIKINLGDAQGDNWWCVVFPAVCFVDSRNPQNFEYISKIWEIINSVTK